MHRLASFFVLRGVGHHHLRLRGVDCRRHAIPNRLPQRLDVVVELQSGGLCRPPHRFVVLGGRVRVLQDVLPRLLRGRDFAPTGDRQALRRRLLCHGLGVVPARVPRQHGGNAGAPQRG